MLLAVVASEFCIDGALCLIGGTLLYGVKARTRVFVADLAVWRQAFSLSEVAQLRATTCLLETIFACAGTLESLLIVFFAIGGVHEGFFQKAYRACGCSGIVDGCGGSCCAV